MSSSTELSVKTVDFPALAADSRQLQIISRNLEIGRAHV